MLAKVMLLGKMNLQTKKTINILHNEKIIVIEDFQKLRGSVSWKTMEMAANLNPKQKSYGGCYTPIVQSCPFGS